MHEVPAAGEAGAARVGAANASLRAASVPCHRWLVRFSVRPGRAQRRSAELVAPAGATSAPALQPKRAAGVGRGDANDGSDSGLSDAIEASDTAGRVAGGNTATMTFFDPDSRARKTAGYLQPAGRLSRAGAYPCGRLLASSG